MTTSGAILAALALGACSDDEEKDNTKTDGPALAAEAVEAMNKIEFVNNDVSGTDEDGKARTGKACAVMATKSLAGTQEDSDGNQVEVRMVDGFQYTKASAKAWAVLSGRPSAEAIYEQAIGDKWVKSESDADDLNFFEGKTNDVTKGEVTEFHGQEAVPLTKTEKDGAKKTYYVAAKGEPVILGSIEEGPEPKERAESVLTKADKCEAAAPPADQTITQDEFERKVRELQRS